jgi:response regulator NasT
MEAGVSAYVVKGWRRTACSRSSMSRSPLNRFHVMREELDRARLSLVERKTVDAPRAC